MADPSPEPTGSSNNPPQTFNKAYRQHFDHVYGAGTLTFVAVKPAYLFGRSAALSSHYAGRSFEESEANLRAEYEVEHGSGTFSTVREAVRYAFDLAGSVPPQAAREKGSGGRYLEGLYRGEDTKEGSPSSLAIGDPHERSPRTGSPPDESEDDTEEEPPPA